MVALLKPQFYLQPPVIEVVTEDMPRPARRDALPEHTNYADTGCSLHPSCLTCPLVRCRYDEPGGGRSLLHQDRDQAVLKLQRSGIPVNSIAAQLGVSRRTVFRALARHRAAAAS